MTTLSARDDRQLVGRIVIIEDEPMIGRILEYKLRRDGHDVTWLRSATDGERVLARGEADTALVDATLERDAFAIIAELTQHGTAPRCGWVALVAQRDTEGRRRALEAGAAGIVSKPFKPTAVAALVLELLAGEHA
jgi:DNA-binding response OmpR family regulator